VSDGLGDRHGRSRGKRGLSRAELLVLLAVLTFLVVLLLPLHPYRFTPSREIQCRAKLQFLYKGLRMYLNYNMEFFPPAWHVGGEKVAEDFSNLTYYRFAIHGHCESDFSPTLSREQLQATSGGPQSARQRQYERDAQFWKDREKAWADDYFAPDLVFRMPEDPAAPPCEGVTYEDLTRDVPSGERPLLSDVNASLPNASAKDRADPGHEQEMRSGFSFVRDAGVNVFIGVGPSLRRAGEYATSRFDFRHKGTANVLFLDGHVEPVSSANAERLRRIHDRWNNLIPKGAGR